MSKCGLFVASSAEICESISIFDKVMNTLDKFIFKKRKLTDGTSDIANAAKRQSSTSQTQQCKGVSSASACSSSILSSDREFEHFPSYWSEEQWLQKLKEHEWLFLRNGKLGCSTCKKWGLWVLISLRD